MNAKTTYLIDSMLNAALRNVPYTSPATVYMGLFTADPTASGSQVNEVVGGSYARQPVAFGAPSGGACANSGTVTFPLATAPWGTITHGGIMDAPTAGNMLYHGALAAAKVVGIGDTMSFTVGAITTSEN